jgi:hypothetical protein
MEGNRPVMRNIMDGEWVPLRAIGGTDGTKVNLDNVFVIVK